MFFFFFASWTLRILYAVQCARHVRRSAARTLFAVDLYVAMYMYYVDMQPARIQRLRRMSCMVDLRLQLSSFAGALH